MKNQKIIVAITSIVIIVGFALAIFFYKNYEQQKIGFLAKENAEVFIRDHSPTMGAENPKVYLIEFLDPECESCRAFYPLVKKIMEDFKGQIKLVIRYVPFHGNSKFVIAMLEAARKQSKFWEVLKIGFESQPYWGSHHHPRPEKLWEFISVIEGLDIDKLREDMKDPHIQKVIEQDMQDAKTLGVRQTPTFFVNGKKLQRFGIEPLVELIKSEL